MVDGTVTPRTAGEARSGPVGRTKLHELVAEQLALRVVAGDPAAGESLPPEPDLAEQFGVSKAVIREGVQLLTSARLIRVRHGKRTMVLPEEEWDVLNPLVFEAFRASGRSAELLDDLYAVRGLLEPPAARWMAERAGSEQVSDLIAIVDEIEVAASGMDEPAVLDADRRFHMAIIEAAGANAVLNAIFRGLQALLRGSWSLPLPANQLAEIHRQHMAIADAIREGDGMRAEERMREHIEWAASSDLGNIS